MYMHIDNILSFSSAVGYKGLSYSESVRRYGSYYARYGEFPLSLWHCVDPKLKINGNYFYFGSRNKEEQFSILENPHSFSRSTSSVP